MCTCENMYAHFPPEITINILLQNTKNKMGNSVQETKLCSMFIRSKWIIELTKCFIYKTINFCFIFDRITKINKFYH